MLGPEIWNISEGRMTHKGKAAVVEDAFADFKSPKGSGSNTAVRSRMQSPVASAAATPAAGGAEDKGTPAVPGVKRKKMTRNQLKTQKGRRRQRKLHWPQPEEILVTCISLSKLYKFASLEVRSLSIRALSMNVVAVRI
jgi:elongation factor 3